MKLRHLELFLELSRTKSFTKTSEKAGITQPYLSSKIRVLEKELEAKLIHRKSHLNTLTPSGEVVKRRAENIFNELNLAMEKIHDLSKSKMNGTIAIGTNILDADIRLSIILSSFLKKYPAVKLSFDYYSDIDQAMADGLIDIAIGLSFRSQTPDIHVTSLVTEEYCLFCNRTHPLARCSKIDPELIFQYPIVTYAHQFIERDLLSNWEAKMGKKQTELSTWELSSIYLMLTLVDSASSQNNAVTILPFSIKEFTEEFHNTTVAEIISPPCREITLLTSKKKKHSTIYNELTEKLELIF